MKLFNYAIPFFLFATFSTPLLSKKTKTKKYDWQKEDHWNWSTVDSMSNEDFWQQLTRFFPQDFAWGVATSAFQMEGTQSAHGKHCLNSWTKNAQLAQPGIATGHWDRYKEDVQLIKKAGFTHYRFSIEWSKVEPECGVFDEDALQHYSDLVDELIANGITPIPCLFHHAWPLWFDDKDHFEKTENIHYFTQFALYVFEKLHHKIQMWMTFNEPAGYAMAAYVDAKYPPCKKLAFKECGIWLKNVLNAHVAVAMKFKEINPTVQVGFPHMFNPLDPYNSWNPCDYKITGEFNYLLHDVTLNFFKTGHFDWKISLFGMNTYRIRDYNKNAPKSLDYLGVNYYSHTTIGWFKRKVRENEPYTGGKNGRTIYPEGLYRSIKKANELATALNIPLYIAENGVNDPQDIWKNEFLKKHLSVITRAMQEGIDIRGYYWWTLLDSFSWSHNTDSKMGFYAVDENLNRTLRFGVQPFIEFMKTVQAS
ncbi:MAG: glycoside hydrolase family 1 protein [Candidatus Babeliales bacterium]